MEDVSQILAAYEDAAAQPGGTRLQTWVDRYPEHADELVRYAVGSFVLAHGAATEEISGAEYLVRAEAGRARLRAEMEAATAPALTSLADAARAAGMSAPALARAIGVGMSLLAKLERRLIAPATIPAALVARLAEAVHRSAAELADYLRLPPTVSAQASYRAAQAPRIAGQEDFAAALEASRDTTEEQKVALRGLLGEARGEPE